MEVIEKTHYLAGGVHLGCVPLGFVLEVDLIALEVGLGFSKCKLRLSGYMVALQLPK